MRILFPSGAPLGELLLKATRLEEITVPAYTRRDGTFVPEHRKMVRVSTDRSRDDVLAGRGSAAQREAHARLHRVIPGFASLPGDHQYAHILSHSHGIQNRRNQARDMADWRQRARSGQNPTNAQWQAFYQLSRERQAAELAQVPDQSRLSAPPREGGVSAPAPRASTASFGENNAGRTVGGEPLTEAPPPAPAEDPAEARARADLERFAARSEAIRAAGAAFEGLGMQRQGNRPIWRFARRGDGNEEVSVRVQAVERGGRLEYIVTRGGSFNSTLGGNAVPDVEVGRFSSDMAVHGALQEEIANINRRFAPAAAADPGVLTFRGVQYKKIGGQWHFSARGREWAVVRDRSMQAALERGEDPNPEDARVTPPGERGASTKPVRLNDMTMDRQPDGSWVTRGGMRSDVGSAIAVAADIVAGVSVPVEQMLGYVQGARLRAAELLFRAGWDPVQTLGTLFPVGTNDGPQEGDTKTVLGHTYVLRGGRWHRQDQDQPAQAQTYRMNGDVFRPTADGGWEFQVGDRWQAVGNTAYIDRLNRMRERGQTSAGQTEQASAVPAEGVRANRFEHTADGHNKFWSVGVRGSQVVVHWGRIGTRGQVQVETLGSPEAALQRMSEKIGMKRRGGYAEAGATTIPSDMLPTAGDDARIVLPVRQGRAAEAAPVAPAQRAASQDVTAPPAAPLPANEQAAIRTAMALVQIPEGVSRWSDSATNQQTRRRINQLQELARLGDLDGVTNFATSRSRSNYALVDDYRSALLAAAHQAREALQAAPAPAPSAPIPEPPTITGANPNNTALIAAQRKVAALRAAANAPDPVAAILAIPTSRGNGYMNRADDYKAALLRHFGYDHAGQATREDAAARRPAAPAVASVTAGAPARPAPAAAPAEARSVPVDQDPTYAVNPDGKTAAELGFVPRPNVPLGWTVTTSGVRHPTLGTIPWPDDKMADLARRYLAQGTAKQQAAKSYQTRMSSRLAPLHPAFQNVEAREVEIRAERERREAQERREREAREAEARRQAMEQTRATTARFIDALQALPDVHKPVGQVGANISEYVGDFMKAGQRFGLSEDAMKQAVGRLVVDYGNRTKFRARVESTDNAVTVTFNGNDGTRITRTFTKSGAGKWVVDHSFFMAGSRGSGSAKALFRTSIGVYKSLGIEKVTVHANIDVGGYAWAKFGFLCRQRYWDSLRSRFKSRAEQMQFSSPVVKKRLMKVLADADPKAMFALSDFKDGERNIGKDLLLNSDWYGDLHLNDDLTYRRCVAYIARGN